MRALLFATLSGVAAAERSTDDKALEALRLCQIGRDVQGAPAAFNNAVASDPEHAQAQFQRALFVWNVASQVSNEKKGRHHEVRGTPPAPPEEGTVP